MTTIERTKARFDECASNAAALLQDAFSLVCSHHEMRNDVSLDGERLICPSGRRIEFIRAGNALRLQAADSEIGLEIPKAVGLQAADWTRGPIPWGGLRHIAIAMKGTVPEMEAMYDFDGDTRTMAYASRIGDEQKARQELSFDAAETWLDIQGIHGPGISTVTYPLAEMPATLDLPMPSERRDVVAAVNQKAAAVLLPYAPRIGISIRSQNRSAMTQRQMRNEPPAGYASINVVSIRRWRDADRDPAMTMRRIAEVESTMRSAGTTLQELATLSNRTDEGMPA
jgi:hypothetical protein